MNHTTLKFSALLLLICLCSGSRLNYKQRYHTDANANLTCAVCDTSEFADQPREDVIQWNVLRLACLNNPEKFMKKCEVEGTFKPRGCGKLITKSVMYENSGRSKEIIQVKRFCATEGMEEGEEKCSKDDTISGHIISCICKGNECNSANSVKIGLLQVFVAVVGFGKLLL